MANIRNSNTAYIDTAAALTDIEKRNIKITGILVTPDGGGVAQLVLQDKTTTANKVDIRMQSTDRSELYNYTENPLVFPNGIVAATVTNCVATLSLQETRR